MTVDGQRRSAISPGLRVAIVLKQDQPTGKRTIGVVAQILTSDSFHHRGIKVRLKDGQVGRVQEILPPEASPLYKPGRIRRQLVVLGVTNTDRCHYARTLILPAGETLIALGLDVAGDSAADPEQLLNQLLLQVEKDEKPVPHLATAELTIAGEPVKILAYSCCGDVVSDPQKALWQWTGWRTTDSLENHRADEILSDESQLLFSAWKKNAAG